MAFLTPDPDVFLLSGACIVPSGPVIVTQRHATGCQPILFEIAYQPQGRSSADIDVTWNAISDARRAKGDFIDFWIELRREGDVHPGDLCTLRFPLKPHELWDPDFGCLFSASLQPVPYSTIANVELSVFEGTIQRTRHPFPNWWQGFRYFTSFYRFESNPKDTVLELNIQLGPSPNRIRIGRMFAGTRYDPYVFTPAYELHAHWYGPRHVPNAEEVLADFERQAVAVAKDHRLVGGQSFIRPFIVMIDSTPAFPMLVGTTNSLWWYAREPWPDGLAPLLDCRIGPGDVVFDCGAHAGQMATFFALKTGPTGRILAFEPFPQNILQIKAQARLNHLKNVEPIQAAVGECRKRMEVSNLSQQSRDQGDLGYGDQTVIEVVPLDDYIDRNPTFIKLDVEAAEVEALRGARRILTELRPDLYIEVHTHMLDQFEHTLTDLFEAIPAGCYDIQFQIEGPNAPWQPYVPGAEQGIDKPIRVKAKGRR
jgi:FkbM family methyltransferase